MMMQARASRITSSRIAIIDRGGYRAWNTLANELRSAEPRPWGRRSGVPSLDWGHKHEPQATALFWWRHPEYQMEEGAFQYWHDPTDVLMWEMCGASPDRTLYQRAQLVSGVEAKCPYDPEIHRQYWKEARLPPEYAPQVHWMMTVTDTDHWWFVSLDPRRNDAMQYFELRVDRDDDYQAQLMGKVHRFIDGFKSGEPFTRPKHDYSKMF